MYLDSYTKNNYSYNCDRSHKIIYSELVKKLSDYQYSPSIGFEYEHKYFDEIIEVYQ